MITKPSHHHDTNIYRSNQPPFQSFELHIVPLNLKKKNPCHSGQASWSSWYRWHIVVAMFGVRSKFFQPNIENLDCSILFQGSTASLKKEKKKENWSTFPEAHAAPSCRFFTQFLPTASWPVHRKERDKRDQGLSSYTSSLDEWRNTIIIFVFLHH